MTVTDDDEPPEEITELLRKINLGDAAAKERFALIVYRELRRLAARWMRRERSDHSLQTTGLIHEAYIRLLGSGPVDYANGSHFFATASNMMRSILVDYARKRAAQRRGGGAFHQPADEHLLPAPRTNWDRIVDVDEALNDFAQINPRGAKVVELRFFAGMSEEEISKILGISSRTVKRDWQFAQAWLYGRLGEGYDTSGS